MTAGPLQTWQENDVFEALTDVGLDPNDFKWNRPTQPERRGFRRVQQGPPSQTLIYKPTDDYFLFEYREDNSTRRQHAGEKREYYVEFQPGEETPEQSEELLQWEEARGFVEAWLTTIRRNVSEPNLWERFRREGAAVEGVLEELPPDEHFSPEEQARVQDRLDEFEERILRLRSFDEEERCYVREEIDDLRNRVEQLEKRSWSKLALGTAIRIGIHLGLSAAEFSQVVGGVQQLLKEVPKLVGGG